MKKRITLSILFLLIIGWIVYTQYPKLLIATGYGAKCLASGVFVAGRQPQEVIDDDLDVSIVRYTTSKIDYQKKTVETSFWGHFAQTAIYREGFGCCLTDGISIDSLSKNKLILPKNEGYATWKLPWPKGDQKKDTIFPEVNKNKLDSLINSSFDDRKHTAAVLVVYKGELLAEKYWEEKGITADTRLLGWSMNKSIVNALLGILVKKGKLNIMSPAPVPEWQSDRRKSITISDLMHMSSGLKWNENYLTASDATNMLFRRNNLYAASISVPSNNEPNMIWRYSSGTANILSGIIKNVIHDDKEYYLFPYKELFYKTGMNSAILETDAAGTFVGSSYGYATGRDWARFGLLYYKNGIWEGDTILPKGWVDFTRTPVKASKGKYGALFWLNQSHILPDAPADTYSCQGYRGQMVYIIPSRNLVIVRLGFSEKYFGFNEFLKKILSCFPE